MPNPDNRSIDTPDNDGLGKIVLEIHISPKDLEELRDVLIAGTTHKPSLVAAQFLGAFESVLEHAQQVVSELDAEFYDDLMTLIGPNTIN